MKETEYIINKLDEKRQTADSHADAFISEVLENNELDKLNIYFKHLMYNKQTSGKVIPKDFQEYIAENGELPEWADMKQIDKAEKTFTRLGPALVLTYFCKALPECYACGNGAEVLYRTGRLTDHTRRRVAQTAQFLLDVMSPGGLRPRGHGITTAMKVRLMHASIRHYFVQEVESGNLDYDIEGHGYPINQEDELGTILAFSFTVIDGIEKLGFKISAEEKEAILHLWKCVGYLIGIEDIEKIVNYEEAGKIWNAITERQFKKTEDGTALNNILVEFLDEIIPNKSLDDVILILMQHLMGDEVCDLLGLERPNSYSPRAWISYILAIFLLRFESRGLISRFTSHFVNMQLLNGLEKYIAEGEDTNIYMPPDLKDDWHMDNIYKSLFKFGVKS